MANIKQIDKDNMGALSMIEFVESKGIHTFPRARKQEINEQIVLCTGYSWSSLYFTEGTGRHKETWSRNEAGPHQKQEVTGTYPNTGSAEEDRFMDLAGQELVLRVTDNDGNEKIVGTPDFPLIFRIDADTGDQPESFKSQPFAFFGNTPEKAYHFTYEGSDSASASCA